MEKKWFDKWARLYQDKILNHSKFPDRIKKEDIKEIYFLFFCVYTVANEKNIVAFLQRGEIKRIKSIISKTPIDFDLNIYPVIQVFQIGSESQIFLLITKEDKNYSHMDLISTIRVNTSYVDAFKTSELIYIP